MSKNLEGVYTFDHGPYGVAIATVELVTKGKGLHTTYLVSHTWVDDYGMPDVFQMWKHEDKLLDMMKRDGYQQIDTLKCFIPNETDFDKLYTYDESVPSDNFGDDGRLETFGDDLGRVLTIARKTPKKVWTMIDGDDGMYLVAGYHLVNRIYYVITKESWKSEDESYLIEEYEQDEE